MGVVSKSDFIGEYFISQTLYDNLDLYIAKYEKKYLIQLLGASLYSLFIADLGTNPTPTAQIYKDIFEEFALDNSSCIMVSEGIKKMLIQLIYFEYIRETQLQNTTNGTVKNAAELGEMKNYKNNILRAYNDAVETSYNIQWFINDRKLSYPTFNGQMFHFIGVV